MFFHLFELASPYKFPNCTSINLYVEFPLRFYRKVNVKTNIKIINTFMLKSENFVQQHLWLCVMYHLKQKFCNYFNRPGLTDFGNYPQIIYSICILYSYDSIRDDKCWQGIKPRTFLTILPTTLLQLPCQALSTYSRVLNLPLYMYNWMCKREFGSEGESTHPLWEPDFLKHEQSCQCRLYIVHNGALLGFFLFGACQCLQAFAFFLSVLITDIGCFGYLGK